MCIATPPPVLLLLFVLEVRAKGRTHSLTTRRGFGIFVDHRQIRGEEIHNRTIDFRLEYLPVNVVVLFGDGYEIGAQKDRFDAIDAKQLSMEPSRRDRVEKRSNKTRSLTWLAAKERQIEWWGNLWS
jgi:hypothetical protein